MSRRVVSLILAGLLGAATAASAQNTEPVPIFVADIRGVTAGLPTSTGWTPGLQTGTEVPSRGLGIDAGAHVFVLRGRNVSLGVGGMLLIARSSTSTVIEPTSSNPNPAPLPDVATRMTVLSPQLSVNFGRQLGWSYISVGLGRGRVSSTATLGSASVDNAVDEWTRTLNFGGGARWFVNDHVGVGFDARWHQFAAQQDSASLDIAPRETKFVLGIGISLR
jgi:hypothetical protein